VHRLQHVLHMNPSLVPLIVLLMSIVVFGILLGSRFFSPFALTLILQQVQIVGILAAAQTLVILTKGIDLSVGAIMVLSSVVMGQFTFRYGMPVELAILCGLLCGALCGFVNGWLVAKMKLPPFIVTLGMWQIVLAANFLYSRNETIRSPGHRGSGAASAVLRRQVHARRRGLHLRRRLHGAARAGPGLCAAPHGLGPPRLCRGRRSRGGRAVGRAGQPHADLGLRAVGAHLRLRGLGADRADRLGLADLGPARQHRSITAVVIGGISLFGGRGSILGAFFGALIVGVFTLGLRLLGADAQWTFLLIGMLIIGAVAVDQWIRKVSG
jgi:fructose transport system permease protein